MTLSPRAWMQAIARYCPASVVVPCVALTCWFASLFQMAVGASPKEVHSGFFVLAMGWLSGNAAWWANIWFLLALLRIFFRRRSGILVLMAVACALDSWRLTRYLLDEGGRHTQVYGYGWGAVLWWIAISLLIAANGSLPPARDPDASRPTPRHSWQYPAGLMVTTLLVLILGGTAINQRHLGNTAERARLQTFALKRLPVCRVEPASVPRQPRLAGPLEVKILKAGNPAHGVFDDPSQLLSWGIPAVRYDGRDLTYAQVGAEQMMVAAPAGGAPGAVLTVRDQQTQVTATLRKPSGELIFNQTWNLRADGRGCPDYSRYPKADELPRSLIMAGLGLPADAPRRTAGAEQAGPPVAAAEGCAGRCER
ncbi:hypothetical protein [Pseudomonas putida]